MNDRDCDNCAHHSDGSCSVWECSFERKENDMIYRQDTIDAMEGVDWYHINKGGQLTHGANSKEDEPLYKAKDVYKVLNHMPSAQPTQTDTSNTLKALDCVERQAAIDIEGLDEQIKCEMCRNPMHTVRGCDGNCKYDERLYERIMQILDERIKPLPSAQSETSRIEQELHGKTPEEQYKFLYWLLLKFGLAYTDSRLAVIEWLRGEKEDE